MDCFLLIVAWIIEIILVIMLFKLDNTKDTMDKIESVLEDINSKLGEKEQK